MIYRVGSPYAVHSVNDRFELGFIHCDTSIHNFGIFYDESASNFNIQVIDHYNLPMLYMLILFINGETYSLMFIFAHLIC